MLYNIYKYPILIGAGNRDQAERNLAMARIFQQFNMPTDLADRIARQSIESKIARSEAAIVRVYQNPVVRGITETNPNARSQAQIAEIIRVLANNVPPMVIPLRQRPGIPGNHPVVNPIARAHAERLITLRAQLAAL